MVQLSADLTGKRSRRAKRAAGKFFFYWLVLFLSCLTMAYLGMVMVCVTPNLQMGVTMGATALGFWFLFGGFMLPEPQTPWWWRWVVWLCPTSWSIYAIAADQLGDKVRRP